jgi:hypothetical protein
MTGPAQVAMSRGGSGTSWQPASTPLIGQMWMTDSWMFMLHYNLLAGYDAQGSDRGAGELMSTNWVMGMASHVWEGGLFNARAMLSAEPFTTGGESGYPLLLQTGEAVNGVPLHDRQHPHNLFMELAASYSHALLGPVAYELYVAPVGEPALGPVAFSHRTSAMSNPFAPLGHHWEDATHISFGVATLGLFTHQWKLEASWFNGREPDQNRYDFPLQVPDSYSARLSFNPNENWSFEISYGHLPSPEQLYPGVSVQHLVGSAMFSLPLDSGNWSSTLVVGHNVEAGAPSSTAWLLESNLELRRDTFFGRAEVVQKTGQDLVLAPSVGGNLFTSGVLELGYLREVAQLGPVRLGLGAVGAMDFLPPGLEPYYGTRLPLSGMLFLRLWPRSLSGG